MDVCVGMRVFWNLEEGVIGIWVSGGEGERKRERCSGGSMRDFDARYEKYYNRALDI